MRPDICRTDLMWQVRKRSPATLIDLSPLGTVQASANRVGKLARAYICLYTYVQWWCIVLPSKSIWQVTAIRPTSLSEPPCIARGKTHESIVKFTQKCPQWSFSGVFAFLQGELVAACVAWQDVEQPFARFGRAWWIPLECFSSCCFCSFPAHFTHWQASLCFRWGGEWVWQDCGWALSVCVCVCI